MKNNKGEEVFTSGTSVFDNWGWPEQIDVIVYDDSIEIIYKQTSVYSYTGSIPTPPKVRVFKIRFSCIDGKWNKSDPIYGEIIPAQEESYEFND